MTDIERLCKEIEAAVGRPMQTPKDFDFLSKCINDKLHERVSTSTLKRLWGYVASQGLPRKTTLDLLAQFVDYRDWKNFQKECCSEEAVVQEAAPAPDNEDVEGDENNRVEAVQQKKRKRSLWLLAGVLALIGVLLLLYTQYAYYDNADENFSGKELHGHPYVDLGLPSGTLWATMNVGATAPEDYGNCYAWGETEAKGFYGWDNYRWRQDKRQTLTKYFSDPSYGNPDGKDTLEPADDVAHVLWGNGWRTPTIDEWTELLNNCTWEWTTLNDVMGIRVVSVANGKSIFLPAAGYRNADTSHEDVGEWGHYWTSSLSIENPVCAWNACFDADHFDCSNFRSFRCNGQSIRPVTSK